MGEGEVLTVELVGLVGIDSVLLSGDVAVYGWPHGSLWVSGVLGLVGWGHLIPPKGVWVSLGVDTI